MLHFRCTVVLKNLVNNTLRRPLPGSMPKTRLVPVRHCCIGNASAGSRAVSSQLKVLHAASHRPVLRTASCAAPSRRYCVKTEDSVYLDEQLKKDVVNSEEAGDK